MRPTRFGWQALVLVGLAPGLGCLVSFDGYTATDGADAGSGADATGGDTASGGVGQGGTATGGNGGTATGGKGGTAAGGDTATGGDSATGGDTATGGKGGTATGGKGGSTTTGGASGTAGTTGGSTSTGGAAGVAGVAGAAGGGTAGTGGTGGSGGMPAACPSGRGPAMIEIPKPGGGFYCIDGTEVTNAQYQAFLATGPMIGGQDTRCTWNMNYAPEMGTTCDPLPTTGSNAPVACVDWCDAKKFCEWAGKHLCGAIGGGPSPPASFDDETTDEWYRTCTHAGDHILPYGDTMEGTYCVGYQYGVIRPVNVATVANCQGGYDGVWDISGNVSEWTDTCDGSTGATNNCAHRGGSWYDLKSGAPLYCNSSMPSDTTPMPEVLRRDTRDIHVGFRCCADP